MYPLLVQPTFWVLGDYITVMSVKAVDQALELSVNLEGLDKHALTVYLCAIHQVY